MERRGASHGSPAATNRPGSHAVYVNAFDDGSVEGESRIREAYGANFGRLQALEQAVDPTNFFRENSNIRPDGIARAT